MGFLYEVEQLVAARWESVGTVPGIGSDDYGFRLQEAAADGDRPAQYRVRALTGDGRSFVSVSAAWSPSTVWLSANYPNPFRGSTEIFYDLPAGGGVATLRVYDLRGRLIREFRRDHGGAGRYQIRWSGQDQSGSRVAAGAYFYELEAAGQTKRRKMLLID
ncbi:hypothetical protein DRQ32_07630 [bacterium]|nr:MAG: hypothetical protein DRQ32_07630 [bacterium]